MRHSIAALVLCLLLGNAAAAPKPDDAYARSIHEWRQQRLRNLQKPDGWLTLVGLHWLRPGTQSLGSAPDNDIMLAVGPPHLGSITLHGKEVHLHLTDAAAARIDGAQREQATLRSDQQPNPSTVAFTRGSLSLIERSGRYGLRVKDPQAATLTHFSGLEYFPIDPAFRLRARFEAHPPGKTLEVASVIQTIEAMPNPGALVFEKDGHSFRLETIDEGDGQLFIIFADRSNGKTTYGPGRFLYVDAPRDGHTWIDFNRAYNPPCAFNAYSTCPLPPPQNRLDLEVHAGEKRYSGPGAH